MKHNWEYKPIGDCFAYIKNGAIIKQEKEAGGLPVTRIETLSNGVFNRSKMGYANIFEIGKYEPNVLNNGDLLMSHINSKTYVGRTVIYESLPNEVIIHGMNLLRLIPNDAVRSKFFYYTTLSHYFKSKIVNIRKDSVNQSSFSISDLKKISIPVPPMEVQEQIVAELDKINEVIADCRELLRNLDALAQSLFYDFFGDPISNPKAWETSRFGELCKLSAGGDKPFDTQKEISKDFNIPIYSNGIENEGLYGYTSKPRITCPAITISGRGTLGVPFIRLKPFVPIIRLIVAIPSPVVNLTFLFYMIKLLKIGGKGAAIPQLTVPMVKDLLLPVPPLELQEKFAARIEQIEEQKKAVEQTISELQTLLDSRMDYWFN